MDCYDPTNASLTTEQLATATNTPLDAIRAWQTFGLLSPRPDDTHPVEDIERVRLIQYAEQHGIGADAIARASETHGDVLGHYVEMITGGQARTGRSPAEVTSITRLDPVVLERLWTAAGLQDQDEVYDEDVEALRWLRTALDAGLPEDALAQIVRVFADSLGRVAEAEARLFHYYVHERLRADGLTGVDLTKATEQISEPLERLIEPALIYFHRKAYQRALREDLLLHLAEDTTAPADVPGEMQATILFVDLSGFTPLTQAMGDAAAADLMERFSQLVRAAASRHRGKIVKQIGDEFMLVFPDPTAALTCGLDIEAAASAEHLFPALRLGAHTGTVLYREGDYIGATVNVAARVAAQAGRHEFLITAALRAETGDVPGVEIAPVGARALKGVPGKIEVFGVRRLGARLERVVDPVCLMELDPAFAAAHLTRHGTELHFCSDACLKIFVAAPDKHEAASQD